MKSEFEQLDSLPVRPFEKQDKEIWQPRWKCFCCQDTGKINPHLVRLVIPDYDYDRDRVPMCQSCVMGQKWAHLNELGVLDQRLTFLLCRKLDAYAREDWKRTTEMWFEMAKKRVEQATDEIAQKRNLRQRDRLLAEFILAQRKHELARGDWEDIPDEEVEGECSE